MKVRDIMTSEVVTVHPGATLKQAAQLLVEHRIAGLPVVDAEGRLLGVLSESDFLFKEQGDPEARPSPPSGAPPVADRRRLEAHVVGEAMTAPPRTIGPEKPVAAAARLMLGEGVNRLPVVEDGRLVGIVTRGDLVRAFSRTDAEIAHEIREDIIVRSMRLDSHSVAVEVADGEVTLTGTVDTRADAAALPALVGMVPGVVGVHDRLSWSDDDPEC